MGRTRKSIILGTALAAWLCVAGDAFAGPAPVQNYGVNAPARNGFITVRPGDTVQRVAKAYGVSVAELAAINGLSSPYTLSAGKRLLLPMPRTYKVGRNDTLYSLARMYGVTVGDIANANNIAPPYNLAVGQMLRIPTATMAAAVAAPVVKPEPVQQEKIAQEKIVWAEDLPARKFPTPMLKTPGPSEEHKAFDSLLSKIAGGDDEPEAEPKSKFSLVSAATALPETEDAEVVGRSSRAGFIWPVRGQVISSYGPKSGGLYNDGINIAAPRGTPVKAAAEGTVAYVGDKLKSYGNLVLIRHPGGMVTAYAHLQNVNIKPGARVAKGQVIGAVGSTGTVLNAQLHFEVRRGTRTLDPKAYLG